MEINCISRLLNLNAKLMKYWIFLARYFAIYHLISNNNKTNI